MGRKPFMLITNASSTPTLIRHASADEIADACKIDQEAFAPYGTAESPEIIHARFSSFPDGFWVAMRNSAIVGYASSEKWLTMREPQIDEWPKDTHHQAGVIWCITAMAIRRESQNQGVGTLLLRQMIAKASEQRCSSIVLETSNARSFYSQRGFHELQQRWHGRTKLFVMALSLT